jgi:hypothetical protein
MTVQLCACGFLLSTALIVNAAERITIAVSPLQSMAPTNVRVRVHVMPDADNRGLELSADSGEYYRSSRRDGDRPPRPGSGGWQPWSDRDRAPAEAW